MMYPVHMIVAFTAMCFTASHAMNSSGGGEMYSVHMTVAFTAMCFTSSNAASEAPQPSTGGGVKSADEIQELTSAIDYILERALSWQYKTKNEFTIKKYLKATRRLNLYNKDRLGFLEFFQQRLDQICRASGEEGIEDFYQRATDLLKDAKTSQPEKFSNYTPLKKLKEYKGDLDAMIQSLKRGLIVDEANKLLEIVTLLETIQGLQNDFLVANHPELEVIPETKKLDLVKLVLGATRRLAGHFGVRNALARNTKQRLVASHRTECTYRTGPFNVVDDIKELSRIASQLKTEEFSQNQKRDIIKALLKSTQQLATHFGLENFAKAS